MCNIANLLIIYKLIAYYQSHPLFDPWISHKNEYAVIVYPRPLQVHILDNIYYILNYVNIITTSF